MKKNRVRSLFMFAFFVVAFMQPALTFSAGESEEAEATKVVIWTHSVEHRLKYYDELKKKFNAEHPDIKVEFDIKPPDSIQYLITAAAASKSGPDIIAYWAGPMELEMAKRGDTIPLDPYFSDEKLDQLIGIRRINGKVHGIPMDLFMENLLYNKTLFEKGGLDPDRFPDRWDGFLAACAKLVSAGITPLAFADKEGWSSDFYIDGLSVQGFDSSDEIVSAVMDGTFTDSRYLDAVEKFKELYDKGFLWKGGLAEPRQTYNSQIETQKAAIGRGYSYGHMVEQLGPIFGMARYPVWGKGNLADAVISGVNNVFQITSYSKVPKKAALVIDAFTTPESSDMLYNLTGQVPPPNKNWNSSLIEDPEILNMVRLAGKKSAPYMYVLYPKEAIWDAKTKNIPLYLLGEIDGKEYGRRIDKAKE